MDAFLATMQQVLDYLHTIKITDLIDKIGRASCRERV